MKTLLEEECAILQEMDLIERSISKRMQRNPDIYTPSRAAKNHGILGRRSKIPRGETLLQQHEVQRFLERRKELSQRLLKLMKNESEGYLARELDGNVDKFLSLYEETVKRPEDTADLDTYDMFSCNPEYKELKKDDSEKKQKYRVLSSFCDQLKLSDLFTQAEDFGSKLDLMKSYRMWIPLTAADPVPTYLEYLNQVKTFVPANQDDAYYNYLEELWSYLKAFLMKIDPLGNSEKSIQKIEQDFSFKGEDCYCKVCSKKFAKDTVYDSHLNGKKHKKALARNHRGEILKLQWCTTEILSSLLNSQLQATINDTERFNLLTTREKQLEQEDQKNLSDYEQDYFGSEEEEDSKDGKAEKETYNPLKLPLGPDGNPMPYWLWKVRGLDSEFRCEICGNFEYRGRQAYESHFTDRRHVNGLKMLGITDNFEVFKGLESIDDALKLQKNMNRRQREEVHFQEAGEEVEDEEGNAISKKAYEQLKKQGLI